MTSENDIELHRPEIQSDVKERLARSICVHGDYHEMLSELKSSGALFESQKFRINLEYGERLNKANFLSKTDWEMLVVLELYDRGTFEHALRVFETIHEKVESRRNIGLFLRRHLSGEDVSKEDLFRAAMLHDIGKTAIPKEILLDTTTEEEWMMFAKSLLQPRQYEDVLRTLDENPRLRHKDLVPFAYAIPEDLAESLRDRGVDPNKPLGVIIGKHATISGNILRSYGFPVSAEIAESHHDRPLRELKHPISISSLRAGWILRAADIFDAVRSPRSYKNGNPLERALTVIEKEAERGFIDQKLANLWISDELSYLEGYE
jgi:HD-GYP domain-containing protein (c-di-GMP phosphodiesterase class II)